MICVMGSYGADVYSTVLGALLGTQNGREVEIVNTFELAVVESDQDKVDHDFLVSRRDQCMYPIP
jgi:COP9 signalosome complex subunit 6